jgi:hypothetical protein
MDQRVWRESALVDPRVLLEPPERQARRVVRVPRVRRLELLEPLERMEPQVLLTEQPEPPEKPDHGVLLVLDLSEPQDSPEPRV